MEEVIVMMLRKVDAEKLMLRKMALAADPSLGEKTPSAVTEWLGGLRSVTRVRDFEVVVDEPEELGGTNTAQTPTETLLASLGACLTVGYAVNAALLGIDIEDIKIELCGKIDQRGFFGLSNNRGYLKIDVKVRLVTTATEEELRKLHHLVLETSPVGNTILRNTELKVEMECPTAVRDRFGGDGWEERR